MSNRFCSFNGLGFKTRCLKIIKKDALILLIRQRSGKRFWINRLAVVLDDELPGSAD